MITARFHRILVVALVALSPTIAVSQQGGSRVFVNGYLTQAYGRSDRHRVMGLTPEGTADYRRAAVLARYQPTAVDHFVVQVGHRRLGDSPSMQFEDNVKLDLAFYERRFDLGTRLRVGKSPLSAGIYNETRYAGTLLPFYRAPFTVYSEGIYTSETIDGISASHTFFAGSSWATSVEAFGGSFSQTEFGTWSNDWRTQPPTYMGARLESKDVLGGQAWLSTPVEGLRAGVGGRRSTDLGGIYPRGSGSNTRIWTSSLDGSFERWFARAERLRLETDGFGLTAGYVQAGVRLTPWLWLNGQYELRDDRIEVSPGTWVSVEKARDKALALNVRLSPTSAFKVEAHGFRGFLVEQVTNFAGTPLTAAYFISSFSISF